MSKWLMQGHFRHRHFNSFPIYKERLKARCFGPCDRTLKFRESWRTPKSPFWECECHPHTLPKVGLRQYVLKLIIIFGLLSQLMFRWCIIEDHDNGFLEHFLRYCIWLLARNLTLIIYIL